MSPARPAASAFLVALLAAASSAAGVKVDAASVVAAPSASAAASVAALPSLPLSAAAVSAAPVAAPAPAPAPVPAAAPALVPSPTPAPAQELSRALRAARPETPGGPDRSEHAFAALYDGGNAAAGPVVSDGESAGPRALAPASRAAPAPAARPAVAAPRFPLTRGEIGWRQLWTLLNPYSPANTVPYPLKSDAMLARESRMYRHNVAYVFGYRPETFADAEIRARKVERARVRDERGARIRAAYALPPFDTLRPATASLGRKIGSGAQGDAYEAAGDPRRVVKVFRDATPSQLQEYAAVVNAVADGGAPLARVTLVRLPDGRYGLEMPHFSAEEGWTSLLNYTAFHRGPEARAAEARADEALRAVMRESQRVAGVELADWKAGLGGGISDDYLDNFAYRPKTGELMCFDCVVLW